MVTPTPAWHLAVGEARASRSPLRLSPTFLDWEEEAAGRISPSQEQLGDRGRPGPPSAPGHVPRRCRAVKPLGPQLPSIQWTASGCPPDAGHGGGGGPFKPRSLILTRVVRRKGGAHQHPRKRRLRALPRFAEVTLLTGGPAPVAPEAMLASHVAPAGASRTQSACWSLGAGLPPARPRTGRGSGGRSVSSDGKGRSWNVDLPGSLLAATFCDFALH